MLMTGGNLLINRCLRPTAWKNY